MLPPPPPPSLRQSKFFFLGKIGKITSYIQNQLSRPDIPPKRKFVLVRDQAFVTLQFVAGDRLSDLSSIPTQEVRCRPDNSGMRLCHTLTKTVRSSQDKPNSFVVKRCQDLNVCPVYAMEQYLSWSKSSGVDLANGYLFRMITEAGVVLDAGAPHSGCCALAAGGSAAAAVSHAITSSAASTADRSAPAVAACSAAPGGSSPDVWSL